jgi:predicted dehydrogenase/threonine dehydrogenase-like Zn-dependent dehydrogenase
MRQVAQNYRSGELTLLEVPAPAVRPGGVVVRTECSLISAGTERMKVAESKLSLAGKAKARPDQVRKVMESAVQQGVVATYRKAMNRLDSYTPLGYSLAGVVVEVGEGADEFRVGQRVACAGDQYAHHAEFNWVPTNLCVAVPEGVAPEVAAFATVGSIALHGFRRSGAVLGETAVVIGLGLVGQLLVQILRSAGVRVVGVDVSAERCDLAVKMGATAAAAPGSAEFEPLREALANLTDGAGADHVFLTAGTTERDPVLLAAELARDRATVVDIGKTNLDLPWNSYYDKELEVRLSRSYGPGRYDPSYEERGVDYPIGYVRWTERRNLGAFLGLVAEGRVDLVPLISEVFDFDQAVEVYDRLHDGSLGGIGNVFRYQAANLPQREVRQPAGTARRAVAAGDLVRLGVIGCGNYASTMLLPHLAGRDDVELATVVTRSALSAATAARKFGFGTTATDLDGLLADERVPAVLIATRHESHAALVVRALEAGKAVLVEKPLAVDRAQLDSVAAAVAASGNDRLMVGYNRRFAPMLGALRASFGPLHHPVVVDYTVNAGRLEPDSWYGDFELQGSRFVGEGGHFVDTVSWWLGADPIEVSATVVGADPDNLVCRLVYPDGSVATISYLTEGDTGYPKETFTVVGDGRVARLSNFRRAGIYRGGRKRRIRSGLAGAVDKGQRRQLDAFIEAVRRGSPMPIPFESLLRTSEATFAVAPAAASGRAVELVAGS